VGAKSSPQHRFDIPKAAQNLVSVELLRPQARSLKN
jgi:hypothetical protein